MVSTSLLTFINNIKFSKTGDAYSTEFYTSERLAAMH